MGRIEMRFLFIFIAGLLLTSCDNNVNNTHDVKYYLDNPIILKEVLERCRNDLGSLEDTPNCINAEEASIQQMNENIRKAREKLK